MKTPRDEELILYHYGEADDPEWIAAALAADPAARARYQALALLLAAVPDDPPPARGEDYGARVWARLAPRLASPPAGGSPSDRLAGWLRATRAWLPAGAPRWALAGAAAVLVAAGFLLGRAWDRPVSSSATFALSDEARRRLLRESVATHLEGSERLLLELVNAPAEGPLPLKEERRWAQALLEGNRLYRQAALEAGQRRIAAVLDELEPVLLELAHSPAELPAADLSELRARLDEQSTLFKVRVVGGRLVEASRRPAREGAPTEEL